VPKAPSTLAYGAFRAARRRAAQRRLRLGAARPSTAAVGASSVASRSLALARSTNIVRRFCSGAWIARGSCRKYPRRRATSGRWPAGGLSACSSRPAALRWCRGVRRRWSAGCAGNWRRPRRLTAIRPRSVTGATTPSAGRRRTACVPKSSIWSGFVLVEAGAERSEVFDPVIHKSANYFRLGFIITASL
jgi:hypothetical protein